MAELRFLENTYTVDDYDTVLNTLLKNGHAVPNACRGGHCHSCLMKANSGQPMPFSQMGLEQSLIDDGYFLACQCMIYADIDVSTPDRDKRTCFTAMVAEKEPFNEQVLRLRLQPTRDFAYKSGQYLTLSNIDGITDDYPIASIHEQDATMEFHICKNGNKNLDQYIFEQLGENDALEVQTAFAEHHYQQQSKQQDLLLIACNADLAGAYGLLREALHLEHIGRINLLHLQSSFASAYLNTEIAALTEQHNNVIYAELAIDKNQPENEIHDSMQAQLKSIDKIEHALCFVWLDQLACNDRNAQNNTTELLKALLSDILNDSKQLIPMKA